MVSTLTLIDSLSETGAPDGMICLRQVAINIANELFPEPTLKIVVPQRKGQLP